jgi:hypothetical protein
VLDDIKGPFASVAGPAPPYQEVCILRIKYSVPQRFSCCPRCCWETAATEGRLAQGRERGW